MHRTILGGEQNNRLDMYSVKESSEVLDEPLPLLKSTEAICPIYKTVFRPWNEGKRVWRDIHIWN